MKYFFWNIVNYIYYIALFLSTLMLFVNYAYLTSNPIGNYDDGKRILILDIVLIIIIAFRFFMKKYFNTRES